MQHDHASSLSATGDAADAAMQPRQRFSGPTEFASLVRRAFATAAEQGWREMIVSDENFNDWPLGEQAVIASLNNWAQAGRQFTMVAATYDDIVRRHARFVTWRQTWSHLVECRSRSRSAALDIPSALWSPRWGFHRLDPVRMTGVVCLEAQHLVALRERLSAQLLKSTVGFPATTLGL